MAAFDESLAYYTLVTLFSSTLMYGIHLTTCVPCIKVILWYRGSLKPARAIRWWLLVVTVLMLLVTTLDMILLLHMDFTGFRYSLSHNGSEADFFTLYSWIDMVKTANIGVQTCLGELVLLYRCYHVWGRSWRIIVAPALLQVAANFSTFALPFLEARSHPGALVTSRLFNKWTNVAFSLITAMEILTSGLICYRMWRISCRSASVYSSARSHWRSPVRRALIIFMESGVIMTIGYTVFLVTSLSKSLVIYPVSNMISALVGIAFNLIVIRVSNRKEEDESIPLSQPSYPLQNRFAAVREGTRIETIQVDVTTAVEREGSTRSKPQADYKHAGDESLTGEGIR